MAANQRSIPEVYVPGVPPEDFKDWPRWLDDELNRIRQALEANPVYLVVAGTGNIAISPTPNTIILGIGDTPTFEFPGGEWDSATAIWTCPQEGVYQANASVTIQPFGTGNKTYAATLEVFIDGILRGSVTSGGLDDIQLTVTFAVPRPVLLGENVQLKLTTQHAQFTGNSNYDWSFSMLRSAAS